VGDPGRVATVSKFFDTIEVRKQKREFITHTGTYKGKRITVLSTGIGTDNIDIAFNELDALVNIDLKNRRIKDEMTSLKIIRLGTSGALHADLPPDSFVISQFGLGFDGLMNFYKLTPNAEEARVLSAFNKQFGTAETIAKLYLFGTSTALVELLGKDMFKGITATCSGFYAPQGRVLRYELAYPELIDKISAFRDGDLRVTNFEMETSAMCGLARLLGHETCSVNAIVANRITGEFTNKAEETMDRMILTVLERLTA
jgi:uridine phosphorylase